MRTNIIGASKGRFRHELKDRFGFVHKPKNSRRYADKLRDNKGETLAEVLVAVLIAGVGMLLLASMLMSASKLVESGDTQIKKIYNGSGAIEQGEAAVAEGKAQKTQGVTITFKDQNGNTLTAPGSTAGLTVDIYKDSASGLALYEKSSGSGGN